MKLLFVASLWLILCNVSSVFADDKSHLEAVEEFPTVVNMESAMTHTIQRMLTVKIRQNPKLAPFRKTMQEFLIQHVGWESMKGEIIQMWKNAFTEQEVRELTEFYKTPTGQKAIKAMPALIARASQIGQQRVRENLPELKRMIEEEAKERGIDLTN
jgi:hypothetical protein